MLSKILILFFVTVIFGLEKGGQIFADENKSDENASSLNLSNTSDKEITKAYQIPIRDQIGDRKSVV